jgi:SH3-like domain-containing protein
VEAIVMSPEVNVLSSPTESGTDIFAIHSGLKVKIENQSSGWYEIRLPDGNKGWIESSHLAII